MSEPDSPPSPGLEPGLGRRAVRGAAVTVGAQGTKIGIQVLSVVVLARLISPAEYGLVAMVLAIVGIADIFRDFGLSSAAIRAPRLSRDEQVNLFWVNSALGLVLGIATFVSAPLIAALYKQPVLVPISQALAVNFVLNGMATQYRADLNRRLQFRRLAVADIVGALSGLGVAIAVGVGGGGFWALVGQQIAQAGVMLALVVAGAGWFPGWIRRGVPVRPFLSFGLRLAGSQIVGYIGNNTDTVVLGLTVSPFDLGLYNRSFQLVMNPLGQIRGPLNTVAVPVLARVQEDETRFHSYVARGQMALGYGLVAGLAVVAAAAAPLVAVALGPSWVGATPVICLLAVGAGFQTLSYVGYWVYVTRGLVTHLLHYTFLSTGIRVACVLLGSVFGLIGVAAAMAVAPAIAWPLSFWWLSRRASIPVRALWLGGLRVMLFSGLVGGAVAGTVALTTSWPAWVSLALSIVVGAAAYAAIGASVPMFRRDLRAVYRLVRNNLR